MTARGGRITALRVLAAALAAAGCGHDPTLDTPPDAGVDAAPLGDAAPAPAAEDVADVLSPIRDRYGLPALATLVVRGGAVVARGTNGVRKVGDPTPVTGEDLFQLGADVQAMTATLAAILVQEGALDWSSTLGAVLPDLQMHASYTNVTLEALLGQRGGAPAAFAADIVAAARAGGDPRARRRDAAAALLALGPTAPAGTFQQSDPSILLATAMLEARGLSAWEETLASKLFAPLGITTCRFVEEGPGGAPTVPWGHVRANDAAVPVPPGSATEPPRAFAPAEGLRCSLDDWARFAALHLLGARGQASPLLGPGSFEKLEAPFDLTHGLGWNVVSRPWAGAALALNLSSRDASSYAVAWLLPDKDTIILVASNQGGAGSIKAVDDVVGELVGRFVNGRPP
jgi:CubicO group peptidase (beta-lactamase class C family)